VQPGGPSIGTMHARARDRNSCEHAAPARRRSPMPRARGGGPESAAEASSVAHVVVFTSGAKGVTITSAELTLVVEDHQWDHPVCPHRAHPVVALRWAASARSDPRRARDWASELARGLSLVVSTYLQTRHAPCPRPGSARWGHACTSDVNTVTRPFSDRRLQLDTQWDITRARHFTFPSHDPWCHWGAYLVLHLCPFCVFSRHTFGIRSR
jgi:hypothetical protein